MYSDISKRISSRPRIPASCRVTSVLPTPVGPPGQLDGRGEAGDRVVLAKHHHLEVLFQFGQGLLVVAADRLGGNTGYLGDDALDVAHAHHLLALGGRLQLLVGPRLVDHIDGLVGQEAVGDVAGRQVGSHPQGLVGVAQAVVLLEPGLQALQDLIGVLRAGFHHVDFLEAPAQGLVLVEDAAVLVEGGGADTAQATRTQQWLEQVTGIHDAPGGSTGSYNGVYLVDEQDRVIPFLELCQQTLETFFEIPPVLGARQQGAQVQGIHHAVFQHCGYFAVDDFLGQPLDDGGLTDTGFPHQQRVVLAPAGEDLGNPLHLVDTTDQRVDMPGGGFLVEVGGVVVERVGFTVFTTALLAGSLAGLGAIAVIGYLGDTVGYEIDHVQSRHALGLEKEHSLAFLFTEDRHQHIGPGDLTLAGRLHVKYRPLQHSLEAQGRLGIAIFLVFGYQGCRGIDELDQVAPQSADIGAAGFQHANGVIVVQQGQ
jgi:hypothetical protein